MSVGKEGRRSIAGGSEAPAGRDSNEMAHRCRRSPRSVQIRIATVPLSVAFRSSGSQAGEALLGLRTSRTGRKQQQQQQGTCSVEAARMLCALLRASSHPSSRRAALFGSSCSSLNSRNIASTTAIQARKRIVTSHLNIMTPPPLASSSALAVPETADSLRGRQQKTRAQSSHSHSHAHSHSPFGHSHSHSHAGDTEEAAALAAAFSGAGDRGSRIILLGLASNVALTVAKGLGGVFLHSASLLADAGHSLSDLLGDLVVLFSWKLSRRPASKAFQFGYGKFEALGSLLVASLLVGGALGIGTRA